MRITKLFLPLLFIVFLVVAGLAQVATSRLDGTIQDATGAVIPNATITAVNVKTDVRSTTTSNTQGLFLFPALQPGNYMVTVEAQGFRKTTIANLELNVTAVVSQVIKLEVGAVTESVTVEANTVRVQTTESQISQAVTLRDIDTLPQLGRQPITLGVFAQPGVQIRGDDTTYSVVNGTRQGSNNSTLDGIDVNDSVVPRMGLSMTAMNSDSVGEFRIVTSAGKAEYGRNAGAQQEMITRSGTNEWHGGVFDYLRNTDLNANTFFNNFSGVGVPMFIQNIFGGSLGAPIRHNKTFIFGNYQARRTHQMISRNRTVLTPQAKQGIFRWIPPGTTAIQSFDIAKNDPRGIGVDKQMAAIFKLVPDPNNTDLGDGLNTAGFRFNNPNGSLEDQFTIKGDHNIKDNLHAFLRWSWQRNSSIDSLNNADATYPGQPTGTQGGHRWGFATGLDWVINSRIVNEFRAGHQSATADFVRPGRLHQAMIITNLLNPDPLNTAFAQGRNSPVNEFTDHLSLIKGKHTIKTGLNWRFTTQFGYNDAGAWANVNLTTSFGNAPPANIGPSGSTISSTNLSTFQSLYNDVLGRMSNIPVTYYSDLTKFQPAGSSRVRSFQLHEYGYFVQDDWKMKKNLTLNLGLRWDFNGVPFEDNKMQGTVDKAALINTVSHISDLTIQRSSKWYNNDYNNFAPRIGLVWSPGGSGKTAIRAFYGMFYDRIIGATVSSADGNTPGFAQALNVYPNQNPGSDVRVSDGPIPIPPMPAAPVATRAVDRGTSIILYNPNLRTGYVESFSVSIQREVYRNTVVDAAYVGNRGVKLFMNVDYNQPRIYGDFLNAFKELQANRANGAPVSANNSLVRIFGSTATAISALGASNIDQGRTGTVANTLDVTNYTKYAAAGVSDFYLRNFPQFNQVVMGTNNGRSYYNSFQFSVRRQQGALKVMANYTYSKSMDNITLEGNGFTNTVDNYNLALNRALGDNNRPHVFNAAFAYTLPVGKGHRLAGAAPRWVDSLIGGWDVGLLDIWQSGPPLTFNSGRPTGATTGNMWPVYSGDRNIGGVLRKGDGAYLLTPQQVSQFTYADAGSIGTAGRNAFRGPRFFNIDLSLVKRFKITESKSVTYRAEAYNLLNNVNFAGTGVSIATPTTFGKFSTQLNAARVMQMALRFDF